MTDDFSVQQLQEQVTMLRASLTGVAERERAVTLNASKVSAVLEELLKLSNGPVYNSLYAQSGGKVADFLVAHTDELLDLFSGPLGQRMALGAAAQGERKADEEIKKLQQELDAAHKQEAEALARAHTLAQTMADLLARIYPEAYHWLDDHLGQEHAVADVLLAQDDRLIALSDAVQPARCVASPDVLIADVLIADVPIAKKSPAAPARATSARTPKPAKRQPPTALQSDEQPPAPADGEDQTVQSTGGELQAAPSVGSELHHNDLSERHIDVFHLIGETGEFLIPPLFEPIAAFPWASGWAEDTLQTFFYSTLKDLEAAGLLHTQALELAIPNSLTAGIGKRIMSLTQQGRAFYGAKFGSPAADRLTPFTAKYRTVDAGLLIRLTRQTIEKWNSRPDRKWTATVIDAVWEDEDVFSRIPGAKKSYHASDGKAYAQPDLIIEMKPVSGGASLLGAVEVERGMYKLADLRAKWERAMRCYPPMVTFVVAPNKKKRRFLYTEWKDVAGTVRTRYGFATPCNALLYTLEELDNLGLLGPKQIKSLTNRQKQARLAAEQAKANRKNQTDQAGEPESASEQSSEEPSGKPSGKASDKLLSLSLPGYWNEERTEKKGV